MIKNIEDMQKLGQSNVDSAMRMFDEWNRNWQAIAAEMGDYTKRSFEEGSATLEKLMGNRRGTRAANGRRRSMERRQTSSGPSIIQDAT
jgi:hypothetical protein